MTIFRYCRSCGASGLSSDTDTSDRCPTCESQHEDALAAERDEDAYWRSVDQAYSEYADELAKQQCEDVGKR